MKITSVLIVPLLRYIVVELIKPIFSQLIHLGMTMSGDQVMVALAHSV